MHFSDVSVYLNKGYHIKRLAWVDGITISKVSDDSSNLVVNGSGADLDWEPESLDLSADDWIYESKVVRVTGEDISTSTESGPTIADTHQAKDTFLKGYQWNYPHLDPRQSLFGIGQDGRYINDRYGNRLVRIPPKWNKFISINIIPLTFVIGIMIGKTYG